MALKLVKWHVIFLRFTAVLLLSAGLSACALLKPSPPPPLIYDISAPNDFVKSRMSHSQFLIKEPAALKFLDNERIVIRLNDDTIEYLPKASWSDKLPRMVQARLVDTFENSKRAGAVAKPGDGLVIDYQLISDIRAFEVAIGVNSSQAHVAISVKLLNDANGRVVRSNVFTAHAAVSGQSNASYVKAMDHAFDQVAKEILVWTVR